MRRIFVLILLVGIAGLAAGLGTRTQPGGAAFPGTNGKIAFGSNRDGNGEVYVMNTNGTGQTNLTNNAAYDFDPAWSADGAKIAFASNRDVDTEVYVMNADGSGQTNVTNNSAGNDSTPAWSPDGTKIAFASNRDGNSEVYVMNADGSGQKNLTNNPAEDGAAVWSPDGSKIAFLSNRVGLNDIFVMNADGTSPTNLTNTPGYQDAFPDWSPDGAKITYYAFDVGHDIFVMNADGSGQTNLTNSGSSDYGPVWSPDGSKIAFNSDQDGNQEIYMMNPDGSGAVRLTNNAADDTFPDWQPLAALTPTPTPTPTSVRPPVNPHIDKTVNGQQGPITVTLGDSVTYRWVVTGDREFFATVDDDTHDALDGECPFAPPCERTALVTLLTPGPVTNTSRVVACGIPPWPDRCKAEFDQDSVTVNVVTPTPTSTPSPPPSVGGISLDPQAPELPLRAGEAAGPSRWLLPAIAAAVALALGGAAWYARRR